jgi:hypothetical protein
MSRGDSEKQPAYPAERKLPMQKASYRPISGHFAPDVLERFARTPVIEVVTRAAPDAPVHRTQIWAVVDEDEGTVYVRSIRGVRGRWYREMRAQPQAEVIVDGEGVPVTAVLASQGEIKRATAAYQRKYGNDPHVSVLLDPDIFHATLRLEPR